MPVPSRGVADPSRLFAPEELATLGANTNVLDRKRAKQLAKKEKKKRAAAEKLELELTGGLLGMDVDEGFRAEMDSIPVPATKKQKLERKKKKKQLLKQQERQQRMADPEFPVELQGGDGGMQMDDARRENDFANFLAQMGADEDEEL